MKELMIIILFCLLGNSVMAQKLKIKSDCKLRYAIQDGNIEPLKNDLAYLESLDVSMLDSSVLCMYYLRLSSLHALMQKDSAYEYFSLAMANDSPKVCRLITLLDKSFQQRIADGHYPQEFKWFIDYIPEVNKHELQKSYESARNVGESNHSKQEQNSALAILLKERDQKYRFHDNTNWEKQHHIDALNQRLIDSVYLLYSSIDSFTKQEQDVISLVIHHSHVCAWSFKWIDKYLDAAQRNALKSGYLLQAAIDRFLNPSSGYCRDDHGDLFLKEIKQKYGEPIARKFGYWDY